MYYLDYGGRYPDAFSGDETSLPRGTTDVLLQSLTGYVHTLPTDPRGHGLQAHYGSGDCVDTGDAYAYYYDDIERSYVITSIAEA